MEAPVDLHSNNSVDAISFMVDAVISRHSHPEVISPVVLSSAWSENSSFDLISLKSNSISLQGRLSRIITLTLLSIIGSCGNIFLISSICIEENLKKAGNDFAGTSSRISRSDFATECFFDRFLLASRSFLHSFHFECLSLEPERIDFDDSPHWIGGTTAWLG
jgi:hypothetical protein